MSAEQITPRRQRDDDAPPDPLPQPAETIYRAIVTQAGDAMAVIRDRRLLLVNPAFCDLLGYKETEISGRPITTVIPEREWTKLHEWHQRRRSGEILPPVHAVTGLHREGRELTLEIGSSDITHAGRADLLVIIRNVPERRKAESQLIQAHKMEAIGTLAGGIAHDFNNLLMGIGGYTSLMMLDLNPAHPHYAKLQSIEDQVRSGAELTRQLLGFAREGKYVVQPVALNEVVRKTSGMFGRTKKGLEIQCRLAEELWTVEVDQGQIEQALLNLYLNAWQAMPGGGILRIGTENQTFAEASQAAFSVHPGDYVRISVHDTGIGMDEKTLARIFEPFFTTREMGRGRGLGLASTYGIIKGHGGFIKVSSEKGRGTTFEIFLPASKKAAAPLQVTEAPGLQGQETVLVVDDEEVIVEVMQEILESLGYRVLSARSGREAIAIYQARPGAIDLVILDMIMPDLDGGETFDRLRAIDPALKVILSSGYSLIGQAKQIMERGCSGFLQKPFRIQDVSQKIRDVLEA
jgi:PAS domain S-box-containing protein